jgi:PAS domain S-box-containing protein
MRLFSKKNLGFEYELSRAAFEQNPDAIVVLKGATIVACNEAAVRQHGYKSKADILASNTNDLAPEFQPNGQRSSDYVREHLKAVAKDGFARIEWTIRRSDGTTLPTQVTLLPVVLNGETLLISFRQDISDRVAVRAERKSTLARIASDFEQKIGGVVHIVSSAATEMESTASSLNAAAEQASRQVTAVSAASEQASANVQSVAGATEELSGSVSEISRQVAQSADVAAQAVKESERTNALVNELADAAQKINAVTSMIHDIASQTNLLALNATIEAARAGDAGKGFAVVASEVKGLANQTAKATEDISAQIAAMQNVTRETVTAIQSIGSTIGQINEIATTIASAVEEQGAATQEIARNVQQAAAGTSEVSRNIAGVTQSVSATGSAAGEVLGASGELAGQAETLNGHVTAFLDEVRAA